MFADKYKKENNLKIRKLNTSMNGEKKYLCETMKDYILSVCVCVTVLGN